jgi:hypothetical protein
MPRNDKNECCCEKPERLTGKPEDCTPEKIRECHGDTAEHPCCQESGKQQ